MPSTRKIHARHQTEKNMFHRHIKPQLAKKDKKEKENSLWSSSQTSKIPLLENWQKHFFLYIIKYSIITRKTDPEKSKSHFQYNITTVMIQLIMQHAFMSSKSLAM
ncbi:hypothetical protein V6Z11_A12G245300 [Gossypium hirsutum]